MLVKSARFGDLTVDEQDIITFRNGLPGFPEEREFILLPSKGSSPFVFLQSVQEANLTFVMIDPFTLFTNYEFTIDDDLVQNLDISTDNPPQIFNIVTLRKELAEATANLLAPVIINTQTRCGVQIVLEKTDYTTKHKLFPNGLPTKAHKEGK